VDATGMSLARFELRLTTYAQVSHRSQSVGFSQPNPVGGCVDSFIPPGGWGADARDPLMRPEQASGSVAK
jgi:hypothetical protein